MVAACGRDAPSRSAPIGPDDTGTDATATSQPTDGPAATSQPTGPTTMAEGSATTTRVSSPPATASPDGAVVAPPQARSFDIEKSGQRMTWQQAEKWWVHRPLLRAGEGSLRPGATEYLYSVDAAWRETESGDCDCGVGVVYAYPEAGIKDNNMGGVLAAGGVHLFTHRYEAGK